VGALVVLVCVLSFLHHAAAQMRGPLVPLFATAHGITASGVGAIVGIHMAASAAGSIPLGRAADAWGRRPLLLGGMAVGVATSLLLPLAEGAVALAAIYGLAGLGIAAFTPSALSLIGDAATPARTGRAYAWYSTAHYGAIGVGPFLGGVAVEWWGYRAAFIGSALGIAAALVLGLMIPRESGVAARAPSRAGFRDVLIDPTVWAGWILSIGGLFIQGVVFTFFPLLAQDRGLGPGAIGLVFLVLGLANTAARLPTGWLVDRTGWRAPYAVAGILVAAAATAILPQITGQAALLVLVAVFGGASGVAFVAVSVALAGAATPATRGLVMGGYSTSLYLGLALGSFALGPVIASYGHAAGFVAGGAAGAVGTVLAGLVWARGARRGPAPRLIDPR
jgi:predicted MFS family arabinose efflux permease